MTTTNRSGRRNPVLLTPDNCALLLIDYQPQMFFPTRSIDGQELINNTIGLAKAARVFNVPAILTTVSAEAFSGPMITQLAEVFPGEPPIDRTTMNAWEDPRVVAAVEKTGRRKIVLGGLWTEVCIVLPAITAIDAGYEVYVVADACGGVSYTAHDMAMRRMEQAGAAPITWLQFMLELQRDWARQATYDAVIAIVEEHAGIYGIGAVYAKTVRSQQARKAA